MGNSINARVKFVFLTVLVLVFACVFVWFGYHWVANSVWKNTSTGQSLSEVNLTGTVIISYASKSEIGDSVRIVPAIYNSSSLGILYVPVDKLVGVPDNTVMAYQYSFSDELRFATFTVAQNLLQDNDPVDLAMISHQIYRAYIQDVANSDEGISKLQDATAMTTGDSVKLFPTVSDTGEVLFMEHDLGTTDDVFSKSKPEDWEIKHISADGSIESLTKGVQPKWLNHDWFVYLKNDGIYLHLITDGSDAPLFLTNEPIDVASRLDVSAATNTERHLALSLPSVGVVRIFDIIDPENSPSLQQMSTINESSGSVVFSPNGDLLVLQTAYLNDDSGELLNALSFYSLETKALIMPPFISPNADLNLTYITDWIN